MIQTQDTLASFQDVIVSDNDWTVSGAARCWRCNSNVSVNNSHKLHSS